MRFSMSLLALVVVTSTALGQIPNPESPSTSSVPVVAKSKVVPSGPKPVTNSQESATEAQSLPPVTAALVPTPAAHSASPGTVILGRYVTVNDAIWKTGEYLMVLSIPLVVYLLKRWLDGKEGRDARRSLAHEAGRFDAVVNSLKPLPLYRDPVTVDQKSDREIVDLVQVALAQVAKPWGGARPADALEDAILARVEKAKGKPLCKGLVLALTEIATLTVPNGEAAQNVVKQKLKKGKAAARAESSGWVYMPLDGFTHVVSALSAFVVGTPLKADFNLATYYEALAAYITTGQPAQKIDDAKLVADLLVLGETSAESLRKKV